MPRLSVHRPPREREAPRSSGRTSLLLCGIHPPERTDKRILQHESYTCMLLLYGRKHVFSSKAKFIYFTLQGMTPTPNNSCALTP